jgi:hypothetical protein
VFIEIELQYNACKQQSTSFRYLPFKAAAAAAAVVVVETLSQLPAVDSHHHEKVKLLNMQHVNASSCSLTGSSLCSAQ